MKIGIIKRDRGTEACSVCTMETFLEKVKKENKGKYISLLRERLPTLQGSDTRFIHLNKIPRIYPVAEYRRTADGSWNFKRYNGIVLVEVNRLSGRAEAEFVKSKAALLPQTFLAIVGSSGKSVKIWVRFSLPDGSLPETEEAASLFHAQAYKVAVQCYQPLIPFPITLKEPSLKQSFRMTPEEGNGEWLMTIEIFNTLQEGIREKLPMGKLTHLGRLLKKWNIPNKRTEKGSLYYLKRH